MTSSLVGCSGKGAGAARHVCTPPAVYTRVSRTGYRRYEVKEADDNNRHERPGNLCRLNEFNNRSLAVGPYCRLDSSILTKLESTRERDLSTSSSAVPGVLSGVDKRGRSSNALFTRARTLTVSLTAHNFHGEKVIASCRKLNEFRLMTRIDSCDWRVYNRNLRFAK